MPSAFSRALVNDKSPQLGGDLDLNGFNLDFPTTANISDVLDDDTMATASATTLATSESIKAYVDSQVSGATLTAGNGIDITTGTISVDLAATGAFLEFATGELKASVLDEDNMVSDSAAHLATQQSIKAYADTKIASTEKGAANGVATLDGGGKVPVAQLPNSIMEYQGTWNASTNTPTLADGAGNADTAIGDVYRVTVAGSQDLGSGSITFGVGDYVILNSSKIWEKADTTDSVASVNGQTGIVTLDADDIDDAATTNKFATSAQLTKVDFISITQAVDLDALETASHAAVTLDTVADTTGQAASLSGQELTLNKATTITDGVMSSEDKTKLDGIEAGATADQTGAEIKAAYEAEANTNAFTDAEKTKLSGIETGATADQNAAEVPYTNTTSGLTATDVQAAIDEVEGRVDTLESANAEASEISVTQTTHGLAVGDVIRHNGTSYVKAQADSAANAEALGVVSSVADANNFAFIVAGKISTLSTLTAGSLYYLDPTTAGSYTTTAPTTTGQVDKPLFFAVSATEAIITPYRGIVLD